MLGLNKKDISTKDLKNLPKNYLEGSIIKNLDGQYLQCKGKRIFVLVSSDPSDYLIKPEGPWINVLGFSEPKSSYLETIKRWLYSTF
jgi:hypothetical protein